MQDVNFFLDKAKEICGVKFDKDLAPKIGVKPTSISNYRKGVSLPDPVVCATLAGLTGIPLAQILGVVGEARAISAAEKAVWRKLAATAALLALVILPGLPAHAVTASTADESSHPMYIMRSFRAWTRRLARWIARLIHGGSDAYVLAL